MSSRSPRLLAVSHTGLHSGAERVLARVLVAASTAGWQVRCLVPPGPFQVALGEAGVETGPLPDLKLPDGGRARGAAVLLRRAVTAARLLRTAAQDADLVLVNGLLCLPALRLARLSVPAAWLVHDVVARPDWRALLRLTGGAVDLALPVSDAAAAPLRSAGLPVRVVRNGTTWPVPVAEPSPDGIPVVGCLGLLTPWKGQAVLLEAVALLPGVVVELAGGTFPKDAPYAAQLAERARRPDLDGRVRLLGAVPDVHALLRTWTVAVSPSTSPDPAPLAVLEAMSVGLPVVATTHGGPPEYLADSGVLVPPGDVGALRTALATLLDDPELRASLGAAARYRVDRLYRAQDRLEEVLDVLAGLVRPATLGARA